MMELNADEIRLIEQLRALKFGEAKVIKQDGKIMYVDTTVREKYN